MSTILRRAAGLAVAALVLAGCSSSPQDEPAAPESSASQPAASEEQMGEPSPEPSPEQGSVVDVTDTPGSLEGFEGAREDAEVLSFEKEGEVWLARGTVTNRGTEAVVYRIYASAMGDGGSTTRGVVQVDVPAVAAGESAQWQAELPLADAELELVLRVERAAAD